MQCAPKIALALGYDVDAALERRDPELRRHAIGVRMRPVPRPSVKLRLSFLSARVGALLRAIEESDEARIEEAVLRLSRSRRVFAPLAFAVGAFALLFDGLRLLVSNWRLTLVQVLPAIWIWLAMADLKAHVLHGHSFNVLRGPCSSRSSWPSSRSRS